jgi:hypothetical protein
MCFGLAKIGQKNIRKTFFSTILSTSAPHFKCQSKTAVIPNPEGVRNLI